MSLGLFVLDTERGSSRFSMLQILIWKWQIASQAADIPTKRSRKGTKNYEGWIALPPFDLTDIIWRNIRRQCQVFLGKTFNCSRLADSLTEDLERSWFFQP